jgi:hypothetical protein
MSRIFTLPFGLFLARMYSPNNTDYIRSDKNNRRFMRWFYRNRKDSEPSIQGRLNVQEKKWDCAGDIATRTFF